MIHQNVFDWEDIWLEAATIGSSRGCDGAPAPCSGAGDQNKAAEESRLRNQNRNRERERSNIKIPVTGPQLMRRLTNQPHLCPRHAPWCKLAFNLPNPTEPESTSKLKAAQSYGIGNRIREQSRWVNNYWGAGALEERDYAVMCGLTRASSSLTSSRGRSSRWSVTIQHDNLFISDDCGSLEIIGRSAYEHFR